MFSIHTKWVRKPVQIKSSLVSRLKDVYEESQLLYNMAYGFLSSTNETLKSRTMSNEDLCDFGFLCRELAKLFDELRKEMNVRSELCGSLIAYEKTKEVLSDPSIALKVKGTLATGSPDVKMQAALPKKGSPEYYTLTDFFNVPRDVAETGVLKLDWKQVTEYLTALTQEGKPIPEGFGKQYPKYITTYRKKRCV